jgi:hypothetical protein
MSRPLGSIARSATYGSYGAGDSGWPWAEDRHRGGNPPAYEDLQVTLATRKWQVHRVTGSLAAVSTSPVVTSTYIASVQCSTCTAVQGATCDQWARGLWGTPGFPLYQNCVTFVASCQSLACVGSLCQQYMDAACGRQDAGV